MTLRTRLLLGLVGLLAAGLVVTGAVTYTLVRSFMLNRIDPQLQGASYAVTRNLEISNGLNPVRIINGVPVASPRAGASSGRAVGGRTRGAGAGFPSSPTQTQGGPRSQSPRYGLAPTGTFGELVDLKGRRYGKPLQVVYDTKAPPPPVLPHPLPASKSVGTIFSSTSPGSDGVAYRVLLRPVPGHDLDAVVAIPLTDVDQTLHRLLMVEVLVSVAALAGLAVLALLVVRRGLRPLEDMATTAGAIAGGDLGRRISPADERSEVGQLGLALNAMLGEIEEAFAARAASEDRLRRFLADASHELRTPLTSIRGHAELFDLGAGRNPSGLALSMHHIHDEAKRMGILVDDLLLLARLDQERPLSLHPEELVAVVGKSLATARVAAGDRQLVLDSDEGLVVVCDAERVRRAVDNLVADAIRHSPPGTPVRVTVRRADGVTGMVEIAVADRGSGVPPDQRERIFEPFFRADVSRARVTGGAGLGLAIVAAIAHAHGGSVGVRDNPGGGACVWLRLPGPMRVVPTPGPEEPVRAGEVPSAPDAAPVELVAHPADRGPV